MIVGRPLGRISGARQRFATDAKSCWLSRLGVDESNEIIGGLAEAGTKATRTANLDSGAKAGKVAIRQARRSRAWVTIANLPLLVEDAATYLNHMPTWELLPGVRHADRPPETLA